MRAQLSKILISLVICLAALSAGNASAAISGTISGLVRDSESNKPLSNAFIMIEGTALGATADKSGFYVINNVPVGIYVLRSRMIGYATTKITDVNVKTDQNTTVNFSMSSQVLRLEPEIVITAPRNYLPQEALNSVHHVSERDLTSILPVGNFQDALDILPGVVANHFRGGRTSEVLYLIDGLPVSGATTRELSFLVPNTSIAEMVVQTGGFNAEYGNAQAGVVNIVTKDGRNDFEGVAKFTTNTVGWEKLLYDNFQEAEFAIGGPFAGSFGGPVIDGNYSLAANLQATDTPYRAQLRQAFNQPIKYNYNVNAKLALRLSDNIQLRLQTLGSKWNWHEYDPLWEERLSALPERDNRSLRVSASLTHTFSSKMFYTFSASLVSVQNHVRGAVPAEANPNIYLPGKSPASVWSGTTEPWNESLREQAANFRFNLVRQIHPAHQFSAGLESQIFDITFARARYLSWPLPPSVATTSQTQVYSLYEDNIRRYPFTIAAFVQNKIKTSYMSANVGVRYDIYNMARGTAAVPPQDGNYLDRPAAGTDLIKRVVSPRLSLAFPITDRSQFSVNYGWFYQMPPLFYAFTNSSQSLESYWPILGDLNLEPSRSVAYEVTYRWILSRDILFSATSFWRNTTNLVDALPAPLESSEDGRGFARYANLASAYTNGVEVQLQKNFSQGLSGFLHYSYLRARGTASSAESGFGDLLEGRFIARQVEMPLQWDQNHTLILNLNYAKKGFNLNLLHRFDGPLKAYESPLASRPQLPWRYHLDLKVSHAFKTSLGSLEPFAEARNLLDRRYPTVPDEGIPFNRASSPWQDRFGRSVRIGVTLQ